MRRTQIYLEDEQHARLRERAETAGTTVSDVIRRAVDTELARAPDQDAWRSRWIHAVDATAGAAPDLPPGEEYVDQIRRGERARRADRSAEERQRGGVE